MKATLEIHIVLCCGIKKSMATDFPQKQNERMRLVRYTIKKSTKTALEAIFEEPAKEDSSGFSMCIGHVVFRSFKSNPVGMTKPTAWGIYDTTYELCFDYHSSAEVSYSFPMAHFTSSMWLHHTDEVK